MRWDTREGTYTRYTALDGLPWNQLQSVAVDRDGIVWFGAELFEGKSLFSYDGDEWKAYEPYGERIFNPYDIAVDYENKVWCATINGLWAFRW